MNEIQVFIVDDHQIFRDGLRVLLEAADDIVVVGEADSGISAENQLATLTPDLVLMDIQMPGQNGIETTHRLKQLDPALKILMLTMFEDDQSVFSAMRAGASGYVLKGVKHTEMLRSVRTAAEGGAIFSPRIATRMMDYFDQMQPAQQPVSNPLPDLSDRERDVLAQLAVGKSNRAIAEALTLTPKTVRNYVSQILKKLHVSDREAAAAKARQAGLA